MNLKIKKNSAYYGMIFLFCLMDMNFFYLINTNNVNFFGISFTDCLFIIEVLFTIYIVLKYAFIKKGLFRNRYVRYMLIAFILSVTSAFAGTKTYSQPFWLGISSQHLWLGTIFVFFSIYLLLDAKVINIEVLLKGMMVIIFCYSVVCITQYIVGKNVSFTYSIKDLRYGDNRFYFSTIYLFFFCGFMIDRLLSSHFKISRRLINSIFIIFFTIIISAVVTKGRMATISLLGSILGSFLLRKRFTWTKLFGMVLLLFTFILFLNSEMGSDILTILEGNQSLAGDTSSVRIAGRSYYLNLLSDNLMRIMFGTGSPNINWSLSQEITNPAASIGGSARYYLSDNGIISILVRYGLLGLTWWVILITSCLFQGYRIYKTTGETAYIQFPLVELLGSLTLVPSLFGTRIVFVLYLAMLAYKINNIKDVNEDDKS